MSQAVLERWQAFVQKVGERWQQIMQESQAGFESLLADPALDPFAFINAMNAIELRYKELGGKLEETYSQQVVMQLGGSGGAPEALLRQTMTWLFESFTRFRVHHNGRLVRQLWTRVQALMARPVSCSRCGASLTKTVHHQAESITCAHCGAVNSVTPDPLVYNYFALAPDIVAEEATLESKLALERVESAPLAEVEARARAHWDAYVKARSQVLPMTPQEQQQFVGSRLDMLRRYGTV
jgi:hypothetical protein